MGHSSFSITLTLDRPAVGLSDHVRATVTVEGPAPLAVAAPAEPLAGESAGAWRVRPLGPATTEALPGGRERWVQAYRLDPYVPGPAVPVAFAPFEVGGTAVEVAPRTVRVETAVKDPKPADARPVTAVEEPPAAPASDGWPVVPVVSVAAVVLLVVAAALARRRRPPPPLPPAAWADRELAALEQGLAAGAVDPAAVADRLADTLRGFVERRYGVPATKLTTAELAALGPEAAAGGVPVEALRLVLERCDRAKFAGDPPTADECRDLLAAARAVVAAGEPPIDVRT